MKDLLGSLGRPAFLVNPRSGRITFVNSAGEDLMGAEASRIEGKPWEDYFDASSARKIRDSLHLLADNKMGVDTRKETPIRLKRRTGRPVTVSVTMTRFKKGKSATWVFDLEDLTPLISLQKEKENLVNEMGRVSKLADIGRLTGGIAHELNNPLAILQGLSENMESLLESGQFTAAELMKDLQPMKETVVRMSRIIHSMMSVARGEDPALEKLPITSVWHRAASAFESLEGFHQAKIVNDLDPQHVIAVDSIRVEQIFVNLVKNALQAMRSQDVKEPWIEVKSELQKGQVLVHVTNAGAPIPPEVEENLFTPFFTTKPVGQGFGLGLFLSYNVMRAHGGHISMTNVPGGVRFTMSFPALEGVVAAPAKFNVLLVDDEQVFLDVFSKRLTRMGLGVQSAQSGPEALKVLKGKTRFDLIITDYRMPGVDGAHLVENIREFSQVPVIFVTGYGKEEVLKKLESKGVIQGVILKPVDPAVLVPKIEKVLNVKLPRRATTN